MRGKHLRRKVREDGRFRRSFKCATAVLSIVVVLATVSALILPAIAMSRDTCEIPEHLHSEKCFEEGTGLLTCELLEHTHSQECTEPVSSTEATTPADETEALKEETSTPEIKEEASETGGGITFSGNGYTTTVTATDEARLPDDTVVTVRPVFDSNEPSVAAFSIESEQGDSSTYAADIMNAISWGDVTRIKLFDITLISGNSEVEPSAAVEVKTQFDEPLELMSGEVIYGVHFGEDGVELLPAYTERDENGSVLAVSHSQTSFSTTGYVLVHLYNENDIGPDVLPVHYCIYVNDQWVIAGSTRTGWYGSYNPRDEWPPAEGSRDYITLDQMASVLSQYGLSVESEQDRAALSHTIWYQRAEEDGKTIRHDTTPVQKTVGGESKWVFLLSGNKIKDDGYHIYYVPNGTASGKEADTSTTYESNAELGKDLLKESKFFSKTVRDMNGTVYNGKTPETDVSEIPAVQYILYGDPVEITVVENIDAEGKVKGWQWVNDSGKAISGIDPRSDIDGDGISEPDDRFGYEYHPELGTATYSIKAIEGRTTLIPYSHAVEGADTDTGHTVSLMTFLDGEWQEAGKLNLLYRRDDICNGEWFITAGQVYSILQDFGFSAATYDPDDETNNYHKFTFSRGLFSDLSAEEDMTMTVCDSNDRIDDTTYAIGLGDTLDDFTLFYIPQSDDETFEQVQGKGAKEYGSSELIIGDRFWSISVSDDYQLIYYGYETDNFKVYVPDGGKVDVSVQNALGVLWSVRELWADDSDHPDYVRCKYTSSAKDNFSVYTFTEVNGPLDIEASSLNPTYYVQYFAEIERYELNKSSGTNMIPLIDTSGKNLPQNSDTSANLQYLKLSSKGLGKTDQNAGDPTQLYGVATYKDNAEIYKQQEYVFEKANKWRNIDKLYQNDGYEIESVWVLKEGKDPLSKEEKDWWIYKTDTNGDNIEFTNLASKESAQKDPDRLVQESDGKQVILITEGMVIRLHYVLGKSEQSLEAKFFDYDISSDGKNVRQQGINSVHSGKTDTANRYAFGNDNCFTGMGSALWNSNKLNTSNTNVISTYKGCTFGLVRNIDSSGKVTWGNNIIAPDIFGAGTATGRTDYEGTLIFKRQGDVYTLSASSVPEAGESSRTGLENFFNPSPYTSKIYANIFTNNFWALDDATDKKDGLWGGGTGTKTGVVNGYAKSGTDNTRGDTVSNQNLPPSDDGNGHNWFFGMNFSISFSICSDYIGPLEYIFFGDDDMWVFLDSDTDGDGVMDKSELICDIGGVHSSVGEYVNLRDYLPIDGEYTTGIHSLRFYYTERGASGSTCWMSFTLPSVTSTTVQEGTSEINIEKKLVNMLDNEVESSEDFEFVVGFYSDAEHKEVINSYFSLEIIKPDGPSVPQTTASGKSIFLKAGEKARIIGIPADVYYVIEEKTDERFTVKIDRGEENSEIEANRIEGHTSATENEDATYYYRFTNVLKTYALPSTGGMGIYPFVIGGWLLLAAAVVTYRIRYKNSGNRTKTSRPLKINNYKIM